MVSRAPNKCFVQQTGVSLLNSEDLCSSKVAENALTPQNARNPYRIGRKRSPRETTICAENSQRFFLSRSETWVPKRGGLKAAGKRQESATFLQRSFFDVAVQFFVCCSAAFGPNDFRTAEKTMMQCSSCSAALRKLQCNFRFRLWHVAGVGFRGVRFMTC